MSRDTNSLDPTTEQPVVIPGTTPPSEGYSVQDARRTFAKSLAGAKAAPFFAVIILVLLVLAIPLHSTGFFSLANVANVTRNQTTIAVMAIATVFVIAAGEIDLSFAAVIPVSAYTVALTMPKFGLVAGVAAALAVGAVIGIVNGLVTVLWNLPSFIVTLGTMSVLGGIAIWITESKPVTISNQAYNSIFGNNALGGIPTPILWVVGITIVGYLALNWTPAGKRVLATGSNRDVAESCGIRTNRVRVAVMVVSSVGGALAGLLYSGLLGAAQYDLGSTDLLTVLAATIIGGTALTGGKGSVLGALAASMLLGLLDNALILLGLGVPHQMMLEGTVVVVAIAAGSGTWQGRRPSFLRRPSRS